MWWTARPAEPPAEPEERCDLCSVSIPADHRHMLHVEERRIVCACETCRALFAGDGPYRPVGSRTAWLDGFELPDELWASFRIPIGLVFFFRSSTAGGIVAMYPSPAGTTESELDLGPWEELVAANPVLAGPRDRRRGRDRQPARRRAAACDRPDRRVLPARRPRAGELAGALGRAADRDRRGGLLRGAAGEGVMRERLDEAPVLPAPAPELEVVGVAAAPNAAAPTLHFTLRGASPPAGRCTWSPSRPHTHRPGAPLARRGDARAPGRSLRRAERWAATTTSIVLAQVDVLVPTFTDATEFTVPVPCNYDLEVAATKYLYALPDGQVPLSFHFSGADLLPRRGRAPAGGDGPLGLGARSACRWRRGAG